jgi:tripartite-type tricarboxylate transporter receptor subunit TctC
MRAASRTLWTTEADRGQTVLAENKVGAGGAIAMQFIKGKAATPTTWAPSTPAPSQAA